MRFAYFWTFAALILAATTANARGEVRPVPEWQTGSADEPPVPVGRLTSAVTPERYRLDLTVDPAKERFTGHVEIDVDLAEPARHIDLHGRSLEMRRVSVIVGGQVHEAGWWQLHPSGVARLGFDALLPAGKATLRFDYAASFNDNPAGMFRVNVDGAWYSWSQFESIDARSAFPSFDQPGFKTPFEITLRTPPGLMAVSNAPEQPATSEDGLTVHRFAPTLPLPTYLVAMMVGPFAAVEGAVPPDGFRREPLPLRVVSTRQNADQLDFALEGSSRIVRLLEDYFAEPFPFPKLDQITSPIMPGAMENAGADLYRDGILVMDENAATARQRRFGMVVAHELSHQWFGDLVTPQWWDDIWLNESFANWMGYRIGDAWRPDLNIAAGALAEGFQAMKLDALAAGRPIRQPIVTSDEIDGAFDSITYGKGGHVVAMIAAFLGDELFRKGVRQYLAEHRYGNATSADFFGALAEVAGDERIVPAMKSFVEQQGVPLVTFRPEGRHFAVSQSRYAPLGAAPADTQWIVPLCLRRGKERECKLLDTRDGTIAIGGRGALVPNAGGTGYYRFELPAGEWRALVDRAGKLPGGEAQAVADSLSASVMVGCSGIGELARLARELVRHPDSHAADAATDDLDEIAESGIVDARGKKGWKRFRNRLYAPLLRRFGFDPRAGAYAGEAPERSHRRALIVHRLLWDPPGKDLRSELTTASTAFFAGDKAALDPAWFAPAFEIHVRQGGEQAARQLMEKALASEDLLFRPAAIAAIATSGDLATAKWLLEDFKDERLRSSEKHALLGGVMSRSSTREFGYGWIMSHLDELQSGNGGIFMSTRLAGLFGEFCSVERSEQIAQELRERFAGTPGALELERTIEKVRNCGMVKDSLGSTFSDELAKLK